MMPMSGLHNGDMQILLEQPLEHNSEAGIYIKEMSHENYSAKFNPKLRLLATQGDSNEAYLWDLRNLNDFFNFNCKSIPHIKGDDEDEMQCVSSIHWNKAGDKLLTSSADQVARVWQVDSEAGVEIINCNKFKQALMVAKFCDEADNLLAVGGIMRQVYIWDWTKSEEKEQDVVAIFDHSEYEAEESFYVLELAWQNSKCLAVTGKSKNIYLWSIDSPSQPLVKWEGGH